MLFERLHPTLFKVSLFKGVSLASLTLTSSLAYASPALPPEYDGPPLRPSLTSIPELIANPEATSSDDDPTRRSVRRFSYYELNVFSDALRGDPIAQCRWGKVNYERWQEDGALTAYDEALKWLKAAADQNNEEAKQLLTELEEENLVGAARHSQEEAREQASSDHTTTIHSIEEGHDKGKDKTRSFYEQEEDIKLQGQAGDIPSSSSSSSGSTSVGDQEEKTLFEQHLEDRNRLYETLRAAGIKITEDNIASRFMDELSLHQRLIHNLHGELLNLSSTSFTTQNSLLILDALRKSKSVRRFRLANTRFNMPHFLTLTASIGLNPYLRVIDFTEAAWPEQGLTILSSVLKNNTTLQEIILRPKVEFNEQEFINFYDQIATNKGLKIIVWPENLYTSGFTIKGMFAGSEVPTLGYFTRIAHTNPAAMVHLGAAYMLGLYPSKNSQAKYKKASQLFTKAHEHKHPVAGYELGQLEEEQKHFNEALAWYQRSADLGYAPAQYIISEYHRGVWPKEAQKDPDYNQAYEWAGKSAKQGHPDALYRMGRMYEAGRSVKQDLVKAGEYFYEAILRGHPEAYAALGALCLRPEYVHQDKEMAVYYLTWAQKFKNAAFQSGQILKENTSQ